MRTYRLIAGIASAVGALVSPAVHGGSCDVINSSAEAANLTVGGQSHSLTSGGLLLLDDCSKLVVTHGRIQVRGTVGGIPEKADCDVLRPIPCALGGNSKSLASASGPYVYAPGGHLMSKDVVRASGIPSGNIYSAEAATVFDFSATPSASRFALLAGSGAAVFTAPITAGTVTIPAGTLQRDTKYQWQIFDTGAAKPLATGGFQLVSSEEAAEIDAALAAASAAGTSQIEQTMDRLAVYYEHDLAYEMKQIKTQLRSPQ